MQKKLLILIALSSVFLTSCFWWENNNESTNDSSTIKQSEESIDLGIENKSQNKSDNSEDSLNSEDELKEQKERLVEKMKEKEREEMSEFWNIIQCWDLKYLQEECKNFIYYKNAYKESEITLCEKIVNDENLKNKCIEKVNWSLAVETLDKTKCSNLSNEEEKSYCLNQINSIIQRKNVKDNDTYYAKSSITTNTAKWCKQISDSSMKENCIKKVAIENLDLNMCYEAYETKEEWEECKRRNQYELQNTLILEAYKTKDESICDNAPSKDIEDKCLEAARK